MVDCFLADIILDEGWSIIFSAYIAPSSRVVFPGDVDDLVGAAASAVDAESDEEDHTETDGEAASEDGTNREDEQQPTTISEKEFEVRIIRGDFSVAVCRSLRLRGTIRCSIPGPTPMYDARYDAIYVVRR